MMINFNYLNKTFPGDERIIEQVVEIYISEYPLFISQFKSSVHTKDYYTMKDLAHKWQYTAHVLGLEELHRDLIKLTKYKELSLADIDEISDRVAYQLEENYVELLAFRAAS